MKYLFCIILLAFTATLFSCRTNQFNKAGQRTGRWEFADTLGTQVYKYGRRYKNGIERGKWKYYLDGKLARKEKYHGDTSYNQFFHENGKVRSQGQARLEVSETEIHWFYFGDWEYFDENGRPTFVKTYENGNQTGIRKAEASH